MATAPPVKADQVDGSLLYRDGATVLQGAMQYLIAQCIPGEKLVSLCDKGDIFIIERLNTIHRYLVEEDKKGLAFPTCVSTKHTVANFSPPSMDESILALGDVVKIEISCHINGFVVGMAHNHLIGVHEKIPDVVEVANRTAKHALACMKPEMKLSDFIVDIESVAAENNCKLGIPFPVIHLKQWTARRVRSNDEVFVKDTAYCIDLIIIENDDKVFEDLHGVNIFRSLKTSIKRDKDGRIMNIKKDPPIKLGSAKELWRKTGSSKMPFSLRSIGGDEVNRRLGAAALVKLSLLEQYPPICVKPGKDCARVTFTVLVDEAGMELLTPLLGN